MSFFEPLLDLVLPSACAECALPPTVYCQDCLSRHEAHVVERSYFDSLQPAVAKNLPGLALSVLDESVSRAMATFKEKNQFAVARSMVDALLPTESLWQVDLVVAAPSARANFKKRGFVPAELIAQRVAKRWRLPHMRSALMLVREVEDQASLSIDERQKNLVEAMRANPRLAGKRVLLVDDIVTTGSTIAEAARAVAATAAEPVAFVVLAETLRRQAPSPHPAGFQVGPVRSPKID
jgi:predicted amidophosphoribosyltransferase